MKKILLFSAAVLSLSTLLLTGCGEQPAEQQVAVGEEIFEQSAAADESDADIEIMRQTLSDEDYTAYMEERARKNGASDRWKFNPVLNEYYAADIYEWDEENRRYIFVGQKQQISEEALSAVGMQEDNHTEIPDGLRQELDAFWNAEHKRTDGKPEFEMRSDWVFLDDTEALRTLKANTQVQYFDTWAALSKCWGNANNVIAIVIVKETLRADGLSTDKSFAEDMKRAYQEAAEAVTVLGENITAEDCIELQKQYGYLIAPALQDMGKLDLLQIAPESPCTDAEQLAEFARYFAA